MEVSVDYREIDRIIGEKGTGKASVIPILQAIQDRYRWLPEEVLRYVCSHTEITSAQIIGVASFYAQFRLEPVGEHMVKVCVGTACHVKGAILVHDAFQRELKLEAGRSTDPTGKYTLEKVSCLGCCTLAPVVQIDDITYGHVAPDQAAKVFQDFNRNKGKRKGAHTFTADGAEVLGEIRIGLGSCCQASGSDEIRKAVEQTVEKNNIPVKIKHVGCVGMCHQVPLVEIVPVNREPILYAKVDPASVRFIVESHFPPPGKLKRLSKRLLDLLEQLHDDQSWEGIERYSLDIREKHVSAFLGRQIPIATEHRGVIDPLDMVEYQRNQGFKGLKRVLLGVKKEEVIKIIYESGLRGRGGAGFSTGKKWETVALQPSETKYIICNADEGDPGAFMDRMLLESYPYRVIEGMIIAAYAVGAHQGYFYIRAEYPLAVKRIREALKRCYEGGFLGENILDSDYSLDIHLHEGAGAFVCGEETALIASMEGNRGFPRLRPPYPAMQGFRGAPTLVNNTETLAMVPFIIRQSAEVFQSIGIGNSKGTKVFALAGKITRGGLIEVPMGITIREVVEEIGGGVAAGRTFKAVQIGGPSGGCVPAHLGDTRIDFESLAEVGAMMGSGGLVVLDDTDCMVDIARYFLSFTQNESCGKCTFCRIGTKRMLEILNRLCSGKAKPQDLEELENLAGWTKKGSLCGLGRTAPNPVLSTLHYFREEYEAHVNGVCPTGKCQDLIEYRVTDGCIGCTLCAQKCPVDAIPFTPHEKHVINTELCIKCDTCRIVCPEDSIIRGAIQHAETESR